MEATEPSIQGGSHQGEDPGPGIWVFWRLRDSERPVVPYVH